jgi:hypothetical protein
VPDEMEQKPTELWNCTIEKNVQFVSNFMALLVFLSVGGCVSFLHTLTT